MRTLTRFLPLTAILLSACRAKPTVRPPADDCYPGDTGAAPAPVVSEADSLLPGTLLVSVRARWSGAALDRASVRLVSPGVERTTNLHGAARFDSLSRGAHVLKTRLIGYQERMDTLSVSGEAGQQVKLVLLRAAMCLRTVTPASAHALVR